MKGEATGESGAGGELAPCPYLRTREGFAFGRASREHRCEAQGAQGSGAPVRRDRQEALCLGPAHRDCDVYVVAQALPRRRADVVATSRRRIASTAPVLLAGPPAVELPSHVEHRRNEPPRAASGRAAFGPPRRLRRGVTFGAIAVCLLALASMLAAESAFNIGFLFTAATPAASVSHTVSAGSPSASPSVAESPIGSPSQAPTPARTPSAAPSPTPTEATTPSPSPTTAASPSAAPSRTPFRYIVQAGDTIGGIARKFGTTIAAIQAANVMGSSTTIYIGQQLIIP